MAKLARYAIAICLASGPHLLSGTIYYVATNGSDSYSGLSPAYASGTSGPFRTLSRACARLKAGDSLLVREGVYHEALDLETSGTAAQPITISNYNGESPILDGGYTLPNGSVFNFLVKIGGDFVTFSNIAIQRSAGAGLALAGGYDRAIGVSISGARETGLLGGGRYDIIEACTVTDTGNGFGINGQTSWGSGIVLQSDHNTIQHCTSYENRGEGLNTCKNSTNAVIQDSTSYDNRSYNVYVDSAHEATVQRNLVYQTKPGYLMYGITIGAETSLPSGVTICNNLVMGCLANFQVDSNVTTLSGVRVAYNTFVNSVGGINGYTMGVYYRTNTRVFSNCVFENNIVEEDDADRTPVSVGFSHSGLVFDHNCWSQAPAAAAMGTGDVTGDPLLAKSGSTLAGSLSASYFEILESSPARGRALVLDEVTDDYFGTPRTGAPDMGACEFPGGAWSGLVASATGSPTGGVAPLTVVFAGSARGGAPPYTYSWSFGDGVSSVAENPSHTYLSPGVYAAAFAAADAASVRSTATLDVTVYPATLTSLTLRAETGSPAPGQGGTTDPAPGSYSFSYGSTAETKAVPYADYRFSRWTDDATGASAFQAVNRLVMDADRSVAATFCAKCADVNGDLKITPADAQAAFDIYLGKLAGPSWCQLENADANSDGTPLSPNVTPADALAILAAYLNKSPLTGDCSGDSRTQAAAGRESVAPKVSLSIRYPGFISGQDVFVPVLVDSPSGIQAFGLDLAFSSNVLTFVRVEGSELTQYDNQLDANVIPYQGDYRDAGGPPAGLRHGAARGREPEAVKEPQRGPDDSAPYRADSHILRVGGHGVRPGPGPASGVLITLIFRVVAPAAEGNLLTILATYDDLKGASIRSDFVSSPAKR